MGGFIQLCATLPGVSHFPGQPRPFEARAGPEERTEIGILHHRGETQKQHHERLCTQIDTSRRLPRCLLSGVPLLPTDHPLLVFLPRALPPTPPRPAFFVAL